MTLIKRQHIPRPVAIRKDDDRRVRDPDSKIGESIEHRPGCRDVLGAEGLELVRARNNLVEERSGNRPGHAGREQVVQLREDEGRQGPRLTAGSKGRSSGPGDLAVRAADLEQLPRPRHATQRLGPERREREVRAGREVADGGAHDDPAGR